MKKEEIKISLPFETWEIIKGACITVAESNGRIDNNTKEILRKTYFEIKNQIY